MDTLGTPASLGVQLFYVLSAFTLFLSQSRRNEADPKSSSFFFRRFFRIAPMYYIAIIYYLFQMAHAYNQSLSVTVQTNAWGILSNITFTHGLSPFWINSIVPGGWSVGIEVLFYALIPFLSTRLTNLNQAVAFTSYTLLFGFSLTAALLQTRFIQSNQALVEYIFYYLPYQLSTFGCGIIAYFVIIKKEIRVSQSVITTVICSISFILISKLLGKLFLLDLPHTLYLFGGIGFMFLLIFISKHSLILVVNALTQFVGKISYSAYLTHFGVLYWLDKWLPQDLIFVNSILTNVLNFQLKFLVAVVATVCVSVITYTFIEKPCLQLGNRFVKQFKKQVKADRNQVVYETDG